MNRFLRRIATLLLIAAAAIPVSAYQQAQDPATPSDPSRERLEERLDSIKQRLALTPEQVEAIRPILKTEGQKLQALKDRAGDGGGSRRDRRKLGRELKDIRKSTDEQLSRVLSQEQMKELKAIREETRQQLKDRKGRK